MPDAQAGLRATPDPGRPAPVLRRVASSRGLLLAVPVFDPDGVALYREVAFGIGAVPAPAAAAIFG